MQYFLIEFTNFLIFYISHYRGKIEMFITFEESVTNWNPFRALHNTYKQRIIKIGACLIKQMGSVWELIDEKRLIWEFLLNNLGFNVVGNGVKYIR
jgi:hypothetical protein